MGWTSAPLAVAQPSAPATTPPQSHHSPQPPPGLTPTPWTAGSPSPGGGRGTLRPPAVGPPPGLTPTTLQARLTQVVDEGLLLDHWVVPQVLQVGSDGRPHLQGRQQAWWSAGRQRAAAGRVVSRVAAGGVVSRGRAQQGRVQGHPGQGTGHSRQGRPAPHHSSASPLACPHSHTRHGPQQPPPPRNRPSPPPKLSPTPSTRHTPPPPMPPNSSHPATHLIVVGRLLRLHLAVMAQCVRQISIQPVQQGLTGREGGGGARVQGPGVPIPWILGDEAIKGAKAHCTCLPACRRPWPMLLVRA